MLTLPNITQRVERVEEANKRGSLWQLLSSLRKGSRTLIFVSPKRVTGNGDYIDDLTGPLDEWLRKCGIQAIGMHDANTQLECEFALRAFNIGERPIIVATHSVVQHLEIYSDTELIIMYDMPSSIEEYVECVSCANRTNGLAIVYLNNTNAGVARELAQVLKDNRQYIPDWINDFAESAREEPARTTESLAGPEQ